MGQKLMGRPKKKATHGPSPEFRNLTVRASAQWLDWVDRGSRHCRMNMATAVDSALVAYFRAQGFNDPPPPRY